MSCKYDIESDQLKCSFCTQWFKCTLHYANIQRYALKACEKCISNFNYTILHPETYKIYKVLLLDTSISIPPSQTLQTSAYHPHIFQLHQADQDIKTKITSFYEKKMCQLQQEMQRGTSKVEQIIKNIEKSMIQQSKLQFSQKFPRQKLAFLRKIDQLKELPLQHWFQKQAVLRKDSSGLLSSRIKSSYKHNKQNNASIINGTGQRIKNKIKGDTLMESKDKKSLMQSRQSHQDDTLRPKSLNRSIVFKSVKCLDESQDWVASSFNFQESQRAQVTRLLLAQNERQTYLPYPISKENSLIVKNQSKRTQADCILDLKGRTSKGGEIIQLIGAQASKVNFQCFLEALGSQSSAKTVRIIKTGITDYHFDALLRFLSRHSGVETLIVTNNRLSQISVQALSNFLVRNPGSSLKRVYMGNNRIAREHVLSSWQGGERNVELCL